jgi:futalosine hydrolase
MKLLIVSATAGEITPLLQYLGADTAAAWPEGVVKSFIKGDKEVHICITGVGMVATAYALTKALREPYDFVLQAGVGGSFDSSIELGEVLFITSERYGDLGAEDRENYLDIFEMNLLQANAAPFTNMEMVTPQLSIHDKIKLRQVKGLTINTVSGRTSTIDMRRSRYNCAVESMEGAAFHYVCLQENVIFAQVRAISNYVTPRDKSAWRMRDAIINLNNWLIDFIASR